MKMKLLCLISSVLLLLLLPPPLLGTAVEKPRMAVVMSKTSFEKSWEVTQMSGHGWVGVANLAGIPYDTLFLEDVAAGQTLVPYFLMVLAQCTAVEPDTVERLTPILRKYLARGGNLIIDGRLAAFTKDGRTQSPESLRALLGVSASGLKGDSTFRIQVASCDHPITQPFEKSQYLSQPMARGLEIQQFSTGGNVLLVSTNTRETFPFLSCRDSGKNRLVLLSDATTLAGATSIFRNEAPNGFFANQVVNALVRSVQWALYGDLRGPFPAPQFSNANLAAIIRLDADLTKNLDYQKQAFSFLFNTARDSGVVSLYCWVSDEGKKAGWKELAVLGQQLEDLGGQIGTHSKFHRIRSSMGAEKYKEELDGSIGEIETNMASNGARIGNVDLFINPGDTIINSDYEELAKRFQLVMTHGFEQDTPIGFGVMNWFTGNHKGLVVLDDTPSPDWQWFYETSWSYTTAQITNYQEATFDHLFNNVGRGYIYNQMWHDYGISSMPLRRPKNTQEQPDKPFRIGNSSNIAMYEALKSKFATYPIYCPEPYEVVEKLRAMASWDYSWAQNDQGLEITLDLSGLPRPSTADFVGGMGLRIENTADLIQSVFVNGQPHDAFSNQVVILPNLKPAKNQIRVTLSASGTTEPHLTNVSSRMPFVHRTGKRMEFQLLTKSKARFALQLPAPGLVLHADWQEYNRKGDGQLAGYVNSDRTVELVPLTEPGFALATATIPINKVKSQADAVILSLGKGSQPERELVFTSDRKVKEVRFNGQPLQSTISGSKYRLSLPEYRVPASLEIHW
jgi:hypothetical protein